MFVCVTLFSLHIFSSLSLLSCMCVYQFTAHCTATPVFFSLSLSFPCASACMRVCKCVSVCPISPFNPLFYQVNFICSLDVWVNDTLCCSMYAGVCIIISCIVHFTLLTPISSQGLPIHHWVIWDKMTSWPKLLLDIHTLLFLPLMDCVYKWPHPFAYLTHTVWCVIYDYSGLIQYRKLKLCPISRLASALRA